LQLTLLVGIVLLSRRGVGIAVLVLMELAGSMFLLRWRLIFSSFNNLKILIRCVVLAQTGIEPILDIVIDATGHALLNLDPLVAIMSM